MTQPSPQPAARLLLSAVVFLLALLFVSALLTGGLTPRRALDAVPGPMGGPLFAVFAPIGLAPLVVLGLLFPTLFGGTLLLFRQWGAFFAVLSVNTLIVFLHGFFAATLVETGSWWGSQTALWLVVTGVILVGVLWAWRRQVKTFDTGRLRLEAPPKTELLVLGVLSLVCALWEAAPLLFQWRLEWSWWALSLVLCIGLWAGMLYRLACILRDRVTGAYRLHLPTEGVMLWTMLVPAGVLLFWQTTPALDIGESVTASEGQTDARFVDMRPLNPDWRHKFGMVLSTPLLDDGRMFVAAAHIGTSLQGASINGGAVYCLDARSGKMQWVFDDDGSMKPVFSSPRLSGGRLYIGEGFHDDENCKVYCLDAARGKKVWEFTTGSQVESSPCLVGDKVFVGGGDDGLYALDAARGKKVFWRYPRNPDQGRLFRVGAAPVVVEGRLFVGSGVNRNYPEQCETALVCLDAATGKLHWKVKTDLPCWAEPVVAGYQVFFALGNGDVQSSATRPAGRVVCLDTATGQELWDRGKDANGADLGPGVALGDSVLSAPAVDGQQVYFGCRDGYCYCVGRFDGQLRWKKSMGSPVVAGPVLDQGTPTGRALNVYVVSTAGRVTCFDAATGRPHWSKDKLKDFGPFVASSPRLEITATPRGIRRRLFFGASLLGQSVPAFYRYEDLLPAREGE
jgi:outer membrane protein assembly factor BamB